MTWPKQKPKQKPKLAEAKSEKKKSKTQIDTKPGRFFEDQPDVNDDYQIHFYLFIIIGG